MYVVGLIAGALIAVGFALVLRGRGGDEIARAAGSGVLGEGARTAKAQHCQDIAQGKIAAQGIAGADVQETGTDAQENGH